jgi:hypothetical protein
VERWEFELDRICVSTIVGPSRVDSLDGMRFDSLDYIDSVETRLVDGQTRFSLSFGLIGILED